MLPAVSLSGIWRPFCFKSFYDLNPKTDSRELVSNSVNSKKAKNDNDNDGK